MGFHGFVFFFLIYLVWKGCPNPKPSSSKEVFGAYGSGVFNSKRRRFPTRFGRIVLVLDIHICAAAAEILGRFHDSWIWHSHHKVKVGMGNIEPMQNIIKDIPCHIRQNMRAIGTAICIHMLWMIHQLLSSMVEIITDPTDSHRSNPLVPSLNLNKHANTIITLSIFGGFNMLLNHH